MINGAIVHSTLIPLIYSGFEIKIDVIKSKIDRLLKVLPAILFRLLNQIKFNQLLITVHTSIVFCECQFRE